MYQLTSVEVLVQKLVLEAKALLRRRIVDEFEPLDAGEFEQGLTHLCPFCQYQTKKHPRGSAVVRGSVFKCFSCGTVRGVV